MDPNEENAAGGDVDVVVDPFAMFPTEPLDRALSSRAQLFMGVTWLFTSCAILAIICRLLLRRKFTRSISVDDWIMLLALVLHVVYQIFLTLVCHTDFGYPMTTMTVQQIIDMTMYSWLSVPFNMMANLVSRIAVAIMLVEIFGVRKWFKWLTYGYLGVLALVSVANVVYVFCQTSPVEASWDFRIVPNWSLPHFPHHVMTFVQLILFAISDVMFAFLPVWFIWKLNMATRKKIGLMMVMAASVVTMGAAIGRAVITADAFTGNLDTEIAAAQAMDAGHIFNTFGLGSIFAVLEVALVIILGSLPKLKVMTKLNSFQSLSSSINSIVGRFRSQTGGGSTSGSKGSGGAYSVRKTDSDIELNGSSSRHGSTREFHPHPKMPSTQHISSIRGGSNINNNSFTDAGARERADGIRVTEGFAVTYNNNNNNNNSNSNNNSQGQEPRPYV